MEPSALFEKIRLTDVDDKGAALPVWTDLDEEKRAVIAPVLERMALIQSLKENYSAAGADSEATDRLTALDTNLLITCLEMLVDQPEAGEMPVEAADPAIEQTESAAAANDPAPALSPADNSPETALDVSGGQPAAEPIAVAELQADVSADLLLEVKQVAAEAQVEQSVMERPVTTENGTQQVSPVTEENSLRRLFTEILDVETQFWIATRCWVYKDNPIMDWAGLHLVSVGYNESASPEHVRLSAARKRWDVLTQKQRLEEIADTCQSLRREYTRGNLSRSATGALDPVPELLRQAGAAAFDNRVSYLSDGAYEKMERSDDYQAVVVENHETQLKDGEMYVRNSVISRDGGNEWLAPFLNLASVNSQHGETVVQDSLHLGLVVPDKKLVEHLENWLMAALRKVAA